jgi:ferredoxin
VNQPLTLRVDANMCQGHGRCYSLAPELFAPDDTGQAVVKVPEPSADQMAAATLAERSCPERAITVGP